MYFVMGDRSALAKLLPANSVWAEIGVYRGDFSNYVLENCSPREFCLIDNWDFELADHNPEGDEAEHFKGFAGKIHWDHFGDDPKKTQEENYEYVISRFSNKSNVKVIRGKSSEMIKLLPDRHFDVMYIDANHQYEAVLRDMMEARVKLKPGAVMMMNDFYEGPGGAEQNLGVMGAVNTFVKRYNFYYIAMTHGSYADVVLTDNPASSFVQEFLSNLNNSDLQFLGISDALVPNVRYKLYRKDDGQLRYVAML
jgi:hypothetical protein